VFTSGIGNGMGPVLQRLNELGSHPLIYRISRQPITISQVPEPLLGLKMLHFKNAAKNAFLEFVESRISEFYKVGIEKFVSR